MKEAASMPKITKHKVLLCVFCFVSCCNLLWRYFTALNEKTANSDVRHWMQDCKQVNIFHPVTVQVSCWKVPLEKFSSACPREELSSPYLELIWNNLLQIFKTSVAVSSLPVHQLTHVGNRHSCLSLKSMYLPCSLVLQFSRHSSTLWLCLLLRHLLSSNHHWLHLERTPYPSVKCTPVGVL